MKLDDFTSAESWTILKNGCSNHPVITSADVRFCTIWQIVLKRGLPERDIALLVPLTIKVVKTVGK